MIGDEAASGAQASSWCGCTEVSRQQRKHAEQALERRVPALEVSDREVGVVIAERQRPHRAGAGHAGRLQHGAIPAPAPAAAAWSATPRESASARDALSATLGGHHR